MSPEELVRRSHIIVRATALGYFHPPALPRAGRSDEISNGVVRFRVEKVMKGKFKRETLELEGHIIPSDAPRKSPDAYFAGAEYLLMLREDARGYDVSWAAPSPASEQIRGENDPWVSWVSRRIAKESH